MAVNRLEGVAQGQGLFTAAINPWPPDWSFVVIIVNTLVHVQVLTVTSILFTVTVK